MLKVFLSFSYICCTYDIIDRNKKIKKKTLKVGYIHTNKKYNNTASIIIVQPLLIIYNNIGDIRH